MKTAILYFIAAGVVLNQHREAAKAIAAKTGYPVKFRSNSAGPERPEENAGVAGNPPKEYAEFTRYNDKGEIVSKGATPNPASQLDGSKRNKLGLPEGMPETRDELKAALAGEGVEFHPNTKTETLVALFVEAIKAKQPGAEPA